MKISIVSPPTTKNIISVPASKACKSEHCDDIFEIIVVDNGSTDETMATAKKYRGVTVLRELQKGPSHARQRGFMEAKGDHIAFIDADTRVPAGWIDTIKKEFARDPDLVCLSGPFRYYDLAPFQKFLAELLWGITAAPTYWLTGFMALFANCVVKREALAKIGGLDTTIAFYGDDTSLAWRLSKVGKVKFLMNFYLFGSGRRLAHEGLIKTFSLYGISYLSMAFFHKTPMKKGYTEIR